MTNQPIRDPRTERNLEKRTNESRVVDQRMPITFSDKSFFNIPKNLIDAHPEIKFCFIAYKDGEKDLRDRYDDAVFNRGFSLTLASDFPELRRKHSLSPFEERKEDDMIRYGGQVLMHRTTEAYEAEQAFYNEANMHQKTILDSHSSRHGVSSQIQDAQRTWGNRPIR